MVPVLTFFAPDGSLDSGGNSRFARRLSEARVDHLFSLGSAGEFPSVSDDERARLLENVIESATGRTDVWVGCGAPSTRAAVAYAEEAEGLGAAALVAVAPYYLHPPLEAVARYFRAIREAISVPLLAYDIPSFVGYSLPAPFVHRLAREKVLAGVKVTSGSFEAIEALLRDRPEGFVVLPGDDALAARALGAGAEGAVLGTANAVPRLGSELVAAARDEPAAARTLELQGLVKDLVGVLEGSPFPAALKFVTGRLQRLDLGYRAPVDPLSSEEERSVLERLARLEPRLAPFLGT